MKCIPHSWGEEFRGSNWRIIFGNASFDDSVKSQWAGSSQFAFMNQVHSTQVCEARALETQTCDGLTTTSDNLILPIRTADCLPIMIVNGDRIFAIHAGWRGLLGGILDATRDFGAFSRSTLAFIGPHIQFLSFEVGREVIGTALDFLKNHNLAYREQDFVSAHTLLDKAYLNLSYIAKLHLTSLGVAPENIFCSTTDTLTDRLWHSYRRDGLAAGRNIHLISKY